MLDEKLEVTTVSLSIEDIKSLVEVALYFFYKYDFSLVDYEIENKAVAERCMVFRLGWYIQNYMNKEMGSI